MWKSLLQVTTFDVSWCRMDEWVMKSNSSALEKFQAQLAAQPNDTIIKLKISKTGYSRHKVPGFISKTCKPCICPRAIHKELITQFPALELASVQTDFSHLQNPPAFHVDDPPAKYEFYIVIWPILSCITQIQIKLRALPGSSYVLKCIARCNSVSDMVCLGHTRRMQIILCLTAWNMYLSDTH